LPAEWVLSPSSENSSTLRTKTVLRIIRLLSTTRTNSRTDPAVDCQCSAKPGTTMISTGFDHAAFFHRSLLALEMHSLQKAELTLIVRVLDTTLLQQAVRRALI